MLTSIILLAAALPFAASGCEDIFGGARGGAPPLLWRTPLEAKMSTSDELPATDRERVYAIAGGMVTFDARSGEIVWTYRLTFTVPKNATVRNGRVMAAEGIAFALDASTGKELWRFTPDSHSGFGESTADDRAFYFGTASHRVYALDQNTGALLWSRDLGPDWKYPGHVKGAAVSGDTLYVSAEQFYAQNGYISTGWIFAMDRATGEILWRYQNGEGKDWRTVSSSPTVAGALLLVSDATGNSFFAVDRFTGREVWRVMGAPGKFGPEYSPVVGDGTAYVASADNFVYAVDVQTGQIRWKTRTPASNYGFAVCGSRIFVSWPGLSVLDRTTGRVLYQADEEATEYPTSALVAHGDRVFMLGNRAAYAYRCN
ncbi:PQQ-binding-like beta-propeller repeat protein [Longimicrobium sp.]|uniref:PQQ-binding-like beta-propeller repeat protein n=1 Tax=Longimicrobium sp. TaxID=2029185 RepID=UPI002F91F742